jgi:hypothetical protein
MKTTKLPKIAITSVSIVLGLAMAFNIAVATTQDKESEILNKVSTEANEALRDVRWARVALFDGQPEQSKKYLVNSHEKLAAAEKQAPELVVTVQTQKKLGDKTVASETTSETSDYVPIDAWLTLSEDFVASPEKNTKIKEANEHMKNGDKGKAIEVLKSADIGVSVSRVLVPIKATIKQVDRAITLMNENKYYEANLALKGAEDGVIVDSLFIGGPTTAKDNG